MPRDTRLAITSFLAVLAVLLILSLYGCMTGAWDTAQAHDIYPELTKGTSCPCTGKECEPVQAIPDGKGNYYLPVSGETLPASMARQSPDNRFHRCTWWLNEYWDAKAHQWKVRPNNSTLDGKPKTKCFWAPVNLS